MHLVGRESELLDLERAAALLLLGPDPAAGRGTDTSHQLLHREGLDEVVVGPELEGVDAVVLGAAGADHHDGRADALASSGLDQVPAVAPGKHEVEDADVRALEAKPCEARLAMTHPERIEAGLLEVPSHALRDHVVVLDDQHL